MIVIVIIVIIVIITKHTFNFFILDFFLWITRIGYNQWWLWVCQQMRGYRRPGTAGYCSWENPMVSHGDGLTSNVALFMADIDIINIYMFHIPTYIKSSTYTCFIPKNPLFSLKNTAIICSCRSPPGLLQIGWPGSVAKLVRSPLALAGRGQVVLSNAQMLYGAGIGIYKTGPLWG